MRRSASRPAAAGLVRRVGGVILALALVVRPALAALVDRVAAVVDQDVIALSEVYELGGDYIEQAAAAAGPRGRRQAELEVLDTLIQRALISQEVRRLGLDVTEQELDRTIDDIARRNGLDRENLRTEVEVSGIPWQQYREELRENLRQMKFTQAVIRPRITVDEDELKDAWRRAVREADLPRVAELGAIFIAFRPDDPDRAEARARAEAALARIRAGEPFEAVAAEFDEGPYGAQGGHMGTYREGELVGALDRAAFALQAGETSDPVETPQGIFLLHVFELHTEEAPSYESMRDDLFQQVYAERIEEEIEEWTARARRQAAVVIKLEE